MTQKEVDRDIPKLLAVPARVRFLSIEPLLALVSLRWLAAWPENTGRRAEHPSGNTHHLDNLRRIDWVIVGGESGPGARPMHPDWARTVRDQCAAAGVPFLFKQWGEWVPRGPESMGYPLVEGVPRVRLTDLGENGSDLSAEGDNHVWMQQRAGKRPPAGCSMASSTTGSRRPRHEPPGRLESGRQGLPAAPRRLRHLHQRRCEPQEPDPMPGRPGALGHLQRRRPARVLLAASRARHQAPATRKYSMTETLAQLEARDRSRRPTIPPGQRPVFQFRQAGEHARQRGGHRSRAVPPLPVHRAPPRLLPVAQHAVLVSHLVPPEHAFHALHHDDVEAVMGDMSSP